jgi:hypothetical protein
LSRQVWISKSSVVTDDSGSGVSNKTRKVHLRGQLPR